MKNLITKLKTTKYSFFQLPISGKKALIQFRLIEDEDWGQEIICSAMDKQYIEPDEASDICERLYEALEEATAGKMDKAIRVVQDVFNLFPEGAYAFSYLDVPTDELVEYVQSFAGFESEPQLPDSNELLKLDLNDELWAVIVPEYDELPIWDGMLRFRTAVQQKIEAIPVLLY